MDHRRTPAGNSLILPLWVIVASALLCVGAGVFYAATAGGAGDGSVTQTSLAASSDAPATPSATDDPTQTTTEPTASEPAPSEPAPSEPAPSAAESGTPGGPGAQRDINVGVFNNSRIAGLAATTAAKLRAAGWAVPVVANWHGNIPATTVYYPEGQRAEAELLADDINITRVRPTVSSMRGDRLTVVLIGS